MGGRAARQPRRPPRARTAAGGRGVVCTCEPRYAASWSRRAQRIFAVCLFQNPGSAGAISAVISRGEAEAEAAGAAIAAAAAADSTNGAAAAAVALATADVTVWKAVTEALGRKFVQASDDEAPAL
jgi:hypothetical protein